MTVKSVGKEKAKKGGEKMCCLERRAYWLKTEVLWPPTEKARALTRNPFQKGVGMGKRENETLEGREVRIASSDFPAWGDNVKT